MALHLTNPDGNDVDYMEEADVENKIVNIYKAHGEIIIAAVSQSIPATRFYPNNADQSADIYTAQSFSQLAELIRKHNKAPFLFMKALQDFSTIRVSSPRIRITTKTKNTAFKHSYHLREKTPFHFFVQKCSCQQYCMTTPHRMSIFALDEAAVADPRASWYC